MNSKTKKVGVLILLGALLFIVLSCGVPTTHDHMKGHTASSLGCDILAATSQFLSSGGMFFALGLLLLIGLAGFFGYGAQQHSLATYIVLLRLRIPTYISRILESFRKGIIHSQVYA